MGEMYLHGAHVTSWKPTGKEEVLFLSSQSRWENDRAIRGGIPICFPWFGNKADDPKAPAHGFVRTTDGTITTFDAPNAGTGNTQGTFPFAIDSDGNIVAYEADRRLGYKYYDAMFSVAVDFHIEPRASGDEGTRLTHRIEIKPHSLMAKVMGVMVRGRVPKQTVNAMENIRTLLAQTE